MVQLSFISTIAALALAALPLVAGEEPLQKPKQDAQLGSFTSQGCFSTKQGLKKLTNLKASDMSSATCGAACLEQKKPVFAMCGDTCYCGEKYPPEVDIIADDKCSYACKGNSQEACGTRKSKRFSVWNSGLKVDVAYAKKSTTTSTTKGTKTVTATGSAQTPDSTTTPKTKKTSTKTTKTGKKSTKTSSPSSTSKTKTTATSDSFITATSSSNSGASSASAAAPSSTAPNGASRPLIGAGAAVFAAALVI